MRNVIHLVPQRYVGVSDVAEDGLQHFERQGSRRDRDRSVAAHRAHARGHEGEEPRLACDAARSCRSLVTDRGHQLPHPREVRSDVRRSAAMSDLAAAARSTAASNTPAS
jgi:hypothetical protein